MVKHKGIFPPCFTVHLLFVSGKMFRSALQKLLTGLQKEINCDHIFQSGLTSDLVQISSLLTFPTKTIILPFKLHHLFFFGSSYRSLENDCAWQTNHSTARKDRYSSFTILSSWSSLKRNFLILRHIFSVFLKKNSKNEGSRRQFVYQCLWVVPHSGVLTIN